MEIREKIFGSENLDVAISYYNLGRVFFATRDYEKALDFHFKALDIRKIKLNPTHPDIALSYEHIAEVYNAKGDMVNALKYYSLASSTSNI